jgi:hypothetical protein
MWQRGYSLTVNFRLQLIKQLLYEIEEYNTDGYNLDNTHLIGEKNPIGGVVSQSLPPMGLDGSDY